MHYSRHKDHHKSVSYALSDRDKEVPLDEDKFLALLADRYGDELLRDLADEVTEGEGDGITVEETDTQAIEDAQERASDLQKEWLEGAIERKNAIARGRNPDGYNQ